MSTDIAVFNNDADRMQTVMNSEFVRPKQLQVSRVCGHHNLVNRFGENTRACLHLTILDCNSLGNCTDVDKIQQITLTESQAKQLIDDLQEYFD